MRRRKSIQLARMLRRKSTAEERMLWRRLRGRQLGFKFRRQVPLQNYIVDFACLEKKVVVELDGSQHATPEQQEADDQRDAELAQNGFFVLRFWNREIHESIDKVCNRIYQTCAGR